MIALTLRLDDDVYERLRVEAFEKRVSITSLIRDALDAPSQPVYDEEKIARWLHNWARVTPGEPSEFIQNLAAALVAALRGGELTREETNG